MMILKANGKYIDTMPIGTLFSQEEAYADTIVFEVDRFYNGMDLADFSFAIRGVTESGGETQADLTVTAEETLLQLHWQVGEQFTAEGGVLQLDLFAVWYEDPDADRAAQPPDRILRYQLPPVQVRPLPDSSRTLDSRSYTAFLLEVRETADNAIAEINETVAEFEENKTDYSIRILSCERNITLLKNRSDTQAEEIAALQEQAAGLTPIVMLTQEEYDALETPDSSVLYVIRENA